MKRLAWLIVLSALFTAPLEAQFGRLKKVFDKADKARKTLGDLEITEQEEIALGEAISMRIRERFGVQQDVDQTRYVSLVGTLVVQQSQRPQLPYQFLILDSNVVNAFAAPGGFIHITRGALAAMQNEAELAGVLGHEVAHITEKHTLKGIQKMQGIEVAEGQTSLTQNSQVFERVADEAADLILRGFGRVEELEADKVGVHLSANAGYNPNGLIVFLETLTARNEGNSSKSGLFSSHPETQERIDQLQAEIRDRQLDSSLADLLDRFKSQINYQPAQPSLEEEEMVEGARGLAGQSGEKKGEKDGEKNEEDKEEPKKKSRFSLGKMKSAAGFGEKKQESAEVTGSGAARGVEEDEKQEESGPKNPQAVKVEITQDDLQKFKTEGSLK